MRLNPRSIKETEEVKKEAHREPKCALLLGLKKEDRGRGNGWKIESASHDWVRRGETG